NKFHELGLSDQILEVLEDIGFETPTPIQEKAIPMLLNNDHTDFIGLAQTGTGKTAAFGLPLLDLIDEFADHTQALIMAPTRELGQQIAQQLVEFSKNNRSLNVEVVYGGASIMMQIKAMRKPVQIVVATPGRLLDLIRRKAIRLDRVEYVVLDEADEMLNMGFKEDIDDILEHTGQDRAIWLFSATMPSSIRRIVTKYMDAPLEAVVNTKEISNKDISHQYVITKPSNKLNALRRFMDIQPDMRGVLFCRTKRETEQFADELSYIGYNVAALNGDMSQGQRDKVMRQFKTRSMQLLIATDVAARGIDVKDLTHVIHHSLPDQIEYYTHRSGRTGRAGNKGISLAFISPRETRKINALEHRLKVTFQQISVPSHQAMMESRINNWADHLITSNVNDRAAGIVEDLQDKFADLSKEDILARLVSGQLQSLMAQGGNQSDLNESGETRRSDRKITKRGDRGHTGIRSRPNVVGGSKFGHNGGDSNRYFINVGTMDGVNEDELVSFITKVAGINKSNISGMSLQKKCAYFDVDPEQAKGIGDKFKGTEMDGRPVRVNRDSDSNRPKKGKKKFGDRGGSKFKGKSGGGKFKKGKKKY
ncbi:UNVERIFIED_CONTAM: hypothetical protein GTU68_029074, partial [Idotea baltica]|nr:hypothetical protein [Idotea baltica]